jgi:hypothetical protein
MIIGRFSRMNRAPPLSTRNSAPSTSISRIAAPMFPSNSLSSVPHASSSPVSAAPVIDPLDPRPRCRLNLTGAVLSDSGFARISTCANPLMHALSLHDCARSGSGSNPQIFTTFGRRPTSMIISPTAAPTSMNVIGTSAAS